MAGNTVSTIYINGREAENSLKGLTALAAKLSNELKRAELGTEEFAKKAEKWRNVTALIDDQKKSLREYMDAYGKVGPATGSLSLMRQKHQELVQTLDQLEVGTQEWLDQLNRVKESEKNINKVNESMKAAEKTVVGSLDHIRQLHQILVKTLDQLEVGTTEWLDQLNKVKESEKKMAALNQTMRGVDKTVVGSLEHIKQQHQALIKTLDGLEVGTKEWFDQLKKIDASEKDIADLNKLMQEHKSGVKAATGSLEDMRKKHSELVKTLDQLEVNTQEWREQLEKVKKSEKDLAKINAQLSEAQANTERASSSFGKMGAMMAGAFAVENLIQFGRETMDITNKFEQAHVAFETMLGSKLKAETLQSELMELAAKTPFELMQVQDATKQFLAYGFAAETVVKQVSMIGDIAAGVGIDKLPLITLAYGQVKAATRLMGQELNQFTQNGIPMLEELAKVTGKTPAQVKKMVEMGQIGFPLVQKALENMTGEGGRFHNMMAKQSQTLGGIYSTFKDTFIQNVQLPIGNFIAGPSKAFLSQMTAMMQSSDVTGGKFEKMRDAIESERVELSTLVNRIGSYNQGNLSRGVLLEELKKKYPTFLKNMDIEKVSNEQLRDRLQEVNQQYLAKIMTVEVSKKVVAQQKLEEMSGDYLAKAQVRQAEKLGMVQDFLKDKTLSYEQAKAKLEERLAKGTSLFSDERTMYSHLVGSMNNVANATERMKGQHEHVNTTMEKQSQIVANLKKQYPEIAGALDDIFKPKTAQQPKTPDAKPAGDEEAAKKAAEKAQHELEQQQEKLKRLREQIIAFRNDIAQINGTHDQAEAVKIKEKYDKQIAEAEEQLKSKNPKIVSDSREIIAQLNALRDEELLAAQKKHLRDVQDFLKQHQEEVDAAQISDDEKELNAIRKKYAKQLKEVTELEKNNVEGAHEAKTQLEAVIEAEIAAKEAEQQEKADAKQIADNEKELQDRLKREHDYATFTGNLQAEELQQLDIQYMNIMAAAEKEGRDVTAVKESYNKKKKEIDDKYNKDKLKGEKETTEAIKKAQVDLKLAKISALQEGASMLRGIVGETTALGKALLIFEKAMAISTVFVNLAQEKSAIAAHAATMGPAGVAYGTIQSTIATIRAGMNVASIVGQTVAHFSAPQKFDGGYHYVQGQTDGKTYRARYIGEQPTGMLPSSPSIVLASERGAEYYVNHTALSIPEVDWHVQAIDNIVRYGRPMPQYEQGGYTTPPATTSTTAPAPMFPPELFQLIQSTNQLMNQLLANGIKAEAVIGYAQVSEINTALARINKIEKS